MIHNSHSPMAAAKVEKEEEEKKEYGTVVYWDEKYTK